MEYLITGASRGIGKYLFNRLRNEGKIVFGTYQNTQPTENLELFTKVNIADYDEVNNWIKSLELSEVILINCAATNYNVFLHKSEPNAWREVIETNLIGTYNVIRAVLPLMRDNNYGRIINFSSVLAQVPTQGVSAYAASKSALWGLAKSLAAENASKGITINNLNLGYINEGMTKTAVPDKFKAKIVEKIPNGEFGDVNNIFKAINAIVDLDYMNGASIDINGGLL
jgi:acetoacetyl-CoA reductase/3-oxoacyl-[acyl-carrier protein] reductase